MRLRLPNDQVGQLTEALRRAGTKEIGGQIFGEQLAGSDFRATEFTVQKRRGQLSASRFFVDLTQAARDAMRFFHKTEHRYLRYNYIGEWHSHPSFTVTPSGTDVQSMIALVTDPSFRGNFAALLVPSDSRTGQAIGQLSAQQVFDDAPAPAKPSAVVARVRESDGPTLTDARGLGGLIAQDGFDYQVWDALVRLPAWLTHPAFEGLMIEGLEDFEARFFAPHAPKGRLLDRFQAKTAQLPQGWRSRRSSPVPTFEDKRIPGWPRTQTLVTTALPKGTGLAGPRSRPCAQGAAVLRALCRHHRGQR